MPKYGRTDAEIRVDLCIAVAMMATAMEDHGAKTLTICLERDAVALSVKHAREYLRIALGIAPEEERS